MTSERLLIVTEKSSKKGCQTDSRYMSFIIEQKVQIQCTQKMEQINNFKPLKDTQISNNTNSSRINHKSVYFPCKEGKRTHDREKQLVLIYFDFKNIFHNISHTNFTCKFRKQASD